MWFKLLKRPSKSASTNSLKRLSLVDESCKIQPSAAAAQHAALSMPPLTCVSQASSSCSSTSSENIFQHGVSTVPVTQPNPMRRRSLPAMHIHDQKSTYQDSCGIMSNPPVFDNPLRRRGCCNHNFTEQMSGYRAEAIERELRVKRHSISGDILLAQ